MAKLKEIGSEFWEIENSGSDELFFLSGRTALDFIIRDILAQKQVREAHLPAFCCQSMIHPFIRNNICVKFYDVFYEDEMLQADIPKTKKGDIFFYIKYFGYNRQNMGNLEQIKKSGATIIEDTTHSCYSCCENSASDYSFASYRKWTAFAGLAVAEKKNSEFVISQKNIFNDKYEKLRRDAQERKGMFLKHNKGEKQDFIHSFSEAENLLDVDYINYIPEYETLKNFILLDKNGLKDRRRENARILLEGIKKIHGVQIVFQSVEEGDVPLCVPILVKPKFRDELKMYLAGKGIYCPVHWPMSELHKNIGEKTRLIYDSELSLVCDQRYDERDMKRVITTIEDFFNKK